MTNQVDQTINITIKEVDLVEMGKEKHDEMLAKIETKADKAEIDNIKNTVSENQTQLQEQLQSQSELINTKLDESQVKALIAEAELNDLTLGQVQEEIIKRVADKASTQAVADANQVQDDKISQAILDIQELKKEPEIINVDNDNEALYVKEYDKNTMYGESNRYLKIGNYYIPFFIKRLFAVKKDGFDLELVKGEKYSISIDEFIENDGRSFEGSLQSNNEQVTSGGTSVDIEVSGSTTATLTHEHLDKPIVLNITAVDELNMQKVADSLELTTNYGNKELKLNHILPETVDVDVIKYVFDKEVTAGRNNSYQVFTNPEGESNTLIIEGQNGITTNGDNFVKFPYTVNGASLIRVEIVKDGQSYVKTFDPQEAAISGVGV